MRVDVDTRMITLLGMPLRQSFAARMQNRGYEAAGLNMLYFYTEVDREHLGDVVSGLRYMNFAGFAVTKPNKVEVLQYLDELDPLCEKMGSCNTVVKKADGRLVGYNTDGTGFYTSVTKETGIDVTRHTFFCVGCGGAGRAICSVLAWHGAKKIYVTDLFEESGRSLAASLTEKFGADAEYVPFGSFEPLRSSTFVINASGIGMGKTQGQSPVPAEYLRKEQFCFDACYNPEKTRFLLEAEQKGCRTLNGLGMSLWQGAEQIRLWTGKEPPVEDMRRELLDILAGK